MPPLNLQENGGFKVLIYVTAVSGSVSRRAHANGCTCCCTGDPNLSRDKVHCDETSTLLSGDQYPPHWLLFFHVSAPIFPQLQFTGCCAAPVPLDWSVQGWPLLLLLFHCFFCLGCLSACEISSLGKEKLLTSAISSPVLTLRLIEVTLLLETWRTDPARTGRDRYEASRKGTRGLAYGALEVGCKEMNIGSLVNPHVQGRQRLETLQHPGARLERAANIRTK